MKIKKFRAQTMNEAFKKIKAELGSDAVILNVQEQKKTGAFGVVQARFLEVTAAVDEKPIRHSGTPLRSKETDDVFQTYSRPKGRSNTSTQYGAIEKLQKELEDLRSKYEQLHTHFGTDFRSEQVPPHLADAYRVLLESGVDETLARSLLRRVADEIPRGETTRAVLDRVLLQHMSRLIPETDVSLKPSNRPRVVALIGPTGVGKTTTIAKLAATDAIFHHKKVGLLSMDTYRIAAIDQLRVFADLSKIPMEVAYTPDDMSRALRKFDDKDVLYIDTPGRSPRDGRGIREIQDYLAAVQPDEVHLTVNLSTRSEDLLDTLKRFQMIPSNRMIFSKLDETDRYGNMLTVLKQYRLPVSFVTFGQDVPKTFQPATPSFLSRLILGMETLG
ncbi:MAG: flagellar biosynthesis protein FlhF [Calditrichaeota bacterium]|nr:flagellar biosynthesis protein FlhF [Calditrichota bacterium]